MRLQQINLQPIWAKYSVLSKGLHDTYLSHRHPDQFIMSACWLIKISQNEGRHVWWWWEDRSLVEYIITKVPTGHSKKFRQPLMLNNKWPCRGKPTFVIGLWTFVCKKTQLRSKNIQIDKIIKLQPSPPFICYFLINISKINFTWRIYQKQDKSVTYISLFHPKKKEKEIILKNKSIQSSLNSQAIHGQIGYLRIWSSLTLVKGLKSYT